MFPDNYKQLFYVRFYFRLVYWCGERKKHYIEMVLMIIEPQVGRKWEHRTLKVFYDHEASTSH